MDLIGSSAAQPLRVSAFAALARLFARAFEDGVAWADPTEKFWAAAMGDDTLAFDRAISDPALLMAVHANPQRSAWAALARRAAEFDRPQGARSPVLDRLVAIADLDGPIPDHHFPNSGERQWRLGKHPRLLHWACSEGFMGLSLALLKAGAHPDGVSSSARAKALLPTVSPVCLAFQADHMVLAGALLDAGASVHAAHVDDPEKSFKNLGQAILRRAEKALGEAPDRQERAMHWLYWADERQISLPEELSAKKRPSPASPLELAIAARQALSALDGHIERRSRAENPLSLLNTLKDALLLKPSRDKLAAFFFAALSERSADKMRLWQKSSEDQGHPVTSIQGVSTVAWAGLLCARDALRKPESQSFEEAMGPSLGFAAEFAQRAAFEPRSPALGDARAALASLMPPEAFALWDKATGALAQKLEDDEGLDAPSPELFASLREQFDLSRIALPGAPRSEAGEALAAPARGKSRRL